MVLALLFFLLCPRTSIADFGWLTSDIFETGWPQLPPITQESTPQDKKFAAYYDHFLMRYCVLKMILIQRSNAQVVFRNVFPEDEGTAYAKKPNLEYTYATTEWEPVDQQKAQALVGFMIDHLYQLELEFPNQSRRVDHLTATTEPWEFEVWAANNGITGWNGIHADGSHSAGEVAGPMIKEKFGFVVVPRAGDTPKNLGGLIDYSKYSYNETLRHSAILGTCSCVVGAFADLGEEIPQTRLQSCGIEGRMRKQPEPSWIARLILVACGFSFIWALSEFKMQTYEHCEGHYQALLMT